MIIEILGYVAVAIFGWIAGQFMARDWFRTTWLPSDRVFETTEAMAMTTNALAESAAELVKVFDGIAQAHMGWNVVVKGSTLCLMDGEAVVEEHPMSMGPGAVGVLLQRDSILLDSLVRRVVP